MTSPANYRRLTGSLSSAVSVTTPFELNIDEQPAALRRLAAAATPILPEFVRTGWSSVVLTGMGSSDFAATSTWRRLIEDGWAAWQLDTGDLLENPALLDPGTLLVITSQSGASGEVVELLDRIASGAVRVRHTIGISDNLTSPLALSSDVFLPLHSGPEATVSTKSYLNTLGVHRRLTEILRTGDAPDISLELLSTATAVEHIIGDIRLAGVAEVTAQHPSRRLAYIGAGDNVATANFAALITKEAAKVPAEGYTPGQFRHGPYELAGDGLTAVLFGMHDNAESAGLQRLAGDLINAGSRVVFVGDLARPGAITVPVAPRAELEVLAVNAVVAEIFAVELARANGVVPGEFLYGSKITTKI